MKDLFVLMADADMQQVFRGLLKRTNALGIRQIDARVDRHQNKDNGVFTNAPELIRAIPKSEYGHFILAFDHDGSGCGTSPADCAATLQTRMDSFTFTDRSAAIVIAPELEEWLWCDPAAIAHILGADAQVIAAFHVGLDGPKDKLQKAFGRYRQRATRPGDFDLIVRNSNLAEWESSPSFRFLKQTLQNWFPAP